jgi:hypothetical protein
LNVCVHRCVAFPGIESSHQESWPPTRLGSAGGVEAPEAFEPLTRGQRRVAVEHELDAAAGVDLDYRGHLLRHVQEVAGEAVERAAHALDRAGMYSIRINDQWRISFRGADAAADDVEIVDYH